MSDPFFDRPVLNSPYEYPARHWELDDTGQPTQKIIHTRREARFITPIPKPKKRKPAVQRGEVYVDGRVRTDPHASPREVEITLLAQTTYATDRNLAEGVPRSFTLNSDEVLEALQDPLAGIVQAVKSALEQSPPELASDIAESGVVLTGGGALLRDIDRLLSNETGLPFIIADDPLTCVARGGGMAMEMNDKRIDLLSS